MLSFVVVGKKSYDFRKDRHARRKKQTKTPKAQVEERQTSCPARAIIHEALLVNSFVVFI